jgi:COMPASS component SWD2
MSSKVFQDTRLQGKFKPAKIFKGAVESQPPAPAGYSRASQNAGPKSITGISFDDRGDQIVTAADDETFRLYNCKTGKQVPPAHIFLFK